MADAAGREVPAAVFRVVTAADPGAFAIEPIFPGAQSTARVPARVQALTAALLLSRLFTGEARRQVRRAREAGLSWAELAPSWTSATVRPRSSGPPALPMTSGAAPR